MSEVDIYVFPCFGCGNPEGQVTDTVEYLKKYNITTGGTPPGSFGRFWFDIEGPQYWSGDATRNVEFLKAMIAQAIKLGQRVAVYSSASQWNPIMAGASFASEYPLWYAHYGAPRRRRNGAQWRRPRRALFAHVLAAPRLRARRYPPLQTTASLSAISQNSGDGTSP